MQLQEKIMVADTLAGINGELLRYAEMIPQSENKELKQTLKQFRNACEQSGGAVQHCQREVLLCSCRKGHGRGGSSREGAVHRGHALKESVINRESHP